MKVIKLRKNQKLFKDGFTHAFRFETIVGLRFNPKDPESDAYKIDKVTGALEKIYNDRRWRGQYSAWERDFGSWRRTKKTEWGWTRYQYIAVRSEAVVTQVLLVME